MKKLVLLFFVFQLQAQNFPISETQGVAYTQQRFGANLINGFGVFQKKEGSIIVGTYSNHIFQLSNTKTESLDHYFPSNEFLVCYFELDGLEFFCTSRSITTVKNGTVLSRFSPVKRNEILENFILDKTNKTIYFYLSDNIASTNHIYKYEIATAKQHLVFRAKHYELGFQMGSNGTIYFLMTNPMRFFQIKNNRLAAVASYPKLKEEGLFQLNDQNNFDCFNFASKTFSIYKNGKRINTFSIKDIVYSAIVFHADRYFSITNKGTESLYRYTDRTIEKVVETTVADSFNNIAYNPYSNAFYTTSSTNFIQFFPHLKKYPRLFFNTNSNSVFALQQDDSGRVYAGSYNSGLVTIKDKTITESKNPLKSFLNGSINYQKHILLFGEGQNGVTAFENPNKYWKIADSLAGYYLLESKDKRLYIGTFAKGLQYCKNPKLEFGKKLKWEVVSQKEGLKLNNILTISEDKYGNIWCGQKGIAVYNPKTNKAITWHMNDNERYFGAMCSLKDSYETLWFGSSKGELYYYDGKYATDYNFAHFKKIAHPLLENGNTITFIHQWKDYLILGATDKVLLFDLKKWYANQKVSVRYLNAFETNFSATTEQNCVFTDKRDESIWFSTSDMVYQWDIKKWLSLPTFKVNPTVVIRKDSTEVEYPQLRRIDFKPSDNSFEIQINYQTKDNLPRYISTALVKKKEKPIFEHPNLQTKFQFKNLSAGQYVFYVRVCQQDGSFDIFAYPICIDSFLWQKWWFWFALSLLFLGTVIYFFQKRNEIERHKKKLSQLNLSSLSNQFRPHFMLNTLNSIGSQLRDKPHAEKVISRLGESIDILYGFTQKNKFTLAFSNEMKLVENSIEIQKLLFIPELVLTISNKEVIPDDYNIPVGILQIPVENALLHGLRHKTDGNCHLEITFAEDEKHYFISISDNGVGREKAAKINKFKANGNGLKTVLEMIKIINHHQKNAISFEIIDKTEPLGTTVKIALNKNIDYDKIKV